MATENLRESVKKIFKGPKGARRVDQMSDSQVTAIYMRLKNEGKL